MTDIVLAAGKASRLGGSCKALIEVAGRRAIDRQAELLSDPLVVVRSKHAQAVVDAGYRPVVCDTLGGPIRALRTALEEVDDRDTVRVVFADTMLRTIPEPGNWVLYDYAYGGREWDTVHLYTTGVFSARSWFPASDYRAVAVGAYSFTDVPTLRATIRRVPDDGPFAWLLNAYPHLLSGIRAHGWQDVGTPESLAKYEVDK